MSCAVFIHCSYICEFMYILCDYFYHPEEWLFFYVKYTCDYFYHPEEWLFFYVKYTCDYFNILKHGCFACEVY